MFPGTRLICSRPQCGVKAWKDELEALGEKVIIQPSENKKEPTSTASSPKLK
jgi:hypothetical protein